MQSETQLAWDLASLIFVVLDEEGRVRQINKKGCEVLGFPKEDIEGRNWFLTYVPQEESAEAYRRFKKLWYQKDLKTSQSYLLQKNGQVALINWSHSNIRNQNGSIEAMLFSGEDISDKKVLQNRLAVQEREKRKMMVAAVLEAQEKERLHIANELHDNVGQLLTTCKLLLEGEMQKEDSPVTLNFTYKHLQNAINEIRNISHQLNPAQLNEIGLIDSLEDLVKNVKQASNLNIHLLVEEEKCFFLLDPSVSLVIFRIIQEQLNNILKHAGATRVTIHLVRTEKEVELEIIDDGKGFVYSMATKGLGLTNIYNRAELFNGKVVIHSSPGDGCTLSVYIPLNQ